ncbi:DEAD/DEAH box helicase [Saccharicrinis fermentans]|uniref:DNA 3'-5' helicase n=1 Tax=Saccharicrinis fermentans DSM 9555 = JCM 21142 TaxID=869213 RepID=W7Y156_9BACT|nr:DEAD/DEAH box helicase [Saccharicrinis fermentans]GAF04645.1 ATP-dependent DNA helicase RecQ [Saccharicrinis fermentans DSM 9555 = JCM 21142]
MEAYIKQIQELKAPTFQKIRQIAIDSISYLSKDERDELWCKLNHGVDLLDSHELMCQFLRSFGNMHEAKIHEALKVIPNSIFNGEFDIVDWGCGQALATMTLLDYLNRNKLNINVQKITLIEPSSMVLERAALHVGTFLGGNSKVVKCNKFLDDVTINDFISEGNRPVIHFFSNILDIKQINLKLLAGKLDESVLDDNYIVCVGPLNYSNKRIDHFYDYFKVPLLYEKLDTQLYYGGSNTCTCNIKVFQLKYTGEGNLIPIEFYPEVQFHAAYQLDGINHLSKEIAGKNQKDINDLCEKLTCFETATPFDIGASIYDDVHPILAVLNNIVTRGLPTKASPFIESQFAQAFGLTARENRPNGDIVFSLQKELDYLLLLQWLYQEDNNKEQTEYTKVDTVNLQLVLSPIAIARLQKVILEALMLGRLSLDQDEWRVLVEEKDVPCAAIAFKDLAMLFDHICGLSEDYSYIKFPKIELDIISCEEFSNSPLHLDANVSAVKKAVHKKVEYDLVIETSTIGYKGIKEDSFSHFKVKKYCYFKIQSAKEITSTRTIYTSDEINYRNLVSKDERGEYKEIEERKSLLQYFLQLLFRKQDFRPGQLPILSRALQKKCVIGLLPTGGGKSLTYQIAALLQPGITLIVDPLSSLMKDQYDGLINAGIDCCTYINSTVEDKEARAKQMEKSEKLFVFMSPERLAIYKFRKRLQRMHETSVYFAYGVLDEVHCVSEWGHDFRIPYLHLGRNLYQYVKPKNGHVSLFGLTATASFDVLADVERELSAEGAFVLDADTIVRYENSDRLELQYKIEKVKVKFEEDKFFKFGHLDPGLPRAISLFGPFSSKAIQLAKNRALYSYISEVPKYVNELQNPDWLATIHSRFKKRQNLDELAYRDLKTEMAADFFKKQECYDQAGIVFCPHKANTGISVEANKQILSTKVASIGTFLGGDDTGSSVENLELFRDNKQSVMVATKAFGMGIDKPNVRFTVNMNYSSSLESFVQEAGRAGRDRKMALATILISDYKIERLNPIVTYDGDDFKIKKVFNAISGKWFEEGDLEVILEHYNIQVDPEYIDICTPANDFAKISCSNKTATGIFIFSKKLCEEECPNYSHCDAAKVPMQAREWMLQSELEQLINDNKLIIDKKFIEYQNNDFSTVLHFYKNSFKGPIVEKTNMNALLNNHMITVFKGDDIEFAEEGVSLVKGFLSPLVDAEIGEEIVSFIKYEPAKPVTKEEGTQLDIAKAIYRMTCIGLIDDFTQNYEKKGYRIVSKRKGEGEYIKALNKFLLRYYNTERAKVELEKLNDFKVKGDPKVPIKDEIYKCLAFLIDFVYEKISEKRKRAINDMRTFCISGLDESNDWKDTNENLKDFLYFYFNSKYAKKGYEAANGEPYCITTDTNEGKDSSIKIVYKYLRVIEDEIIGISGTPIDNVKHLQGAVRLIRRSLTDSNPSLSLLNAFCLYFLGTNDNKLLDEELKESYFNGMIEFEKRLSIKTFWEFYDTYNGFIEGVCTNLSLFEEHKIELTLKIHKEKLINFEINYTE